MKSLMQNINLHPRYLLMSIIVGVVVGGAMITIGLGSGSASASRLVTMPNIAGSVLLSGSRLTDQSTPSDVITLMLNSYRQWQTLEMAATTVWYGPKGDTQTVNTSVQIQQFSQVRLQAQQSAADGRRMFDWVWISDGKSIHEQNNLAKTYTAYALPSFAESVEAARPPVAEVPDGAVFRHPMAMLMPTVLGDYIYPGGLMQRQGAVTVIGAEEIAGRPTVGIAWDGTGNSAQYWVDAETGMILKAETYGGEGPGGVFEDTTVTHISYGEVIAPETFAFQPLPDAKFLSYEEFAGQ